MEQYTITIENSTAKKLYFVVYKIQSNSVIYTNYIAWKVLEISPKKTKTLAFKKKYYVLVNGETLPNPLEVNNAYQLIYIDNRIVAQPWVYGCTKIIQLTMKQIIYV